MRYNAGYIIEAGDLLEAGEIARLVRTYVRIEPEAGWDSRNRDGKLVLAHRHAPTNDRIDFDDALREILRRDPRLLAPKELGAPDVPRFAVISTFDSGLLIG